MKKNMNILILTLTISVLCGSKNAAAQSTEERFQDLFTTAGYATAFGAALGAAALSFKRYPESHLRYVAVGASMGFIGGSILGSYIIFSPMFSSASSAKTDILSPAFASHQKGTLLIKPQFNTDKKTLTGIAGEMVLARF